LFEPLAIYRTAARFDRAGADKAFHFKKFRVTHLERSVLEVCEDGGIIFVLAVLQESNDHSAHIAIEHENNTGDPPAGRHGFHSAGG
jgi:hypothetical protein